MIYRRFGFGDLDSVLDLVDAGLGGYLHRSGFNTSLAVSLAANADDSGAGILIEILLQEFLS
jgi:hypothetical protein